MKGLTKTKNTTGFLPVALFRMESFGDHHKLQGENGVGKKVPLLKISYTCPTMMKVGTAIPQLNKIQKILQYLHCFWQL